MILPMIVFSPWAFGTTQPWSIWCMNFAGYALGLLFLTKLFIRKAKGYPAPCSSAWAEVPERHEGDSVWS